MARSSTQLAYAGVPRVNLMPRIETERRERAALVRAWLWGVVAALIGVALIVAGALWMRWSAEQTLAAEQARTSTLLSELESLAGINQALVTQGELETFRADAMVADLEWSQALESLAAVLPPGVLLTGFDLTSGVAPQTQDPASEVGLTGSLTFESSTAIDIATTIRAIRALPGVFATDGQEIISTTTTGLEERDAETRSYTYEVTVDLDQSVYTGAFGQEGE